MIHLEAVADAPRSGPAAAAASADPNAALAEGQEKTLYADSIESLVRNEIQRTKIEMANEVIDAGRCAALRWACWGGRAMAAVLEGRMAARRLRRSNAARACARGQVMQLVTWRDTPARCAPAAPPTLLTQL